MGGQSERSTGIRVLLMAFVANFVVTGIGFYGFGVFFKPLADYFGRGRAGVGLGNGLSLIVGAIWAPRVGKGVDKWGPRPLLIGGSLMTALGLALMSRMTALWEFLILYGVLFSLANLHMGDIVTGSTVARHFPRTAGRALGIATIGVSLGGVLIPPFAQAVLDAYGWQAGFLAMSVTALTLVLFPAIILLRGFDHRQISDEDDNGSDESFRRPLWGMTREQALKSKVFWKMIAMFSLAFFPLGTMLVQQIPFLQDMGIPARQAAMALSISATIGMIGKLAWGYFFDRFGGRNSLIACVAVQMLAVLWLLFARNLWQALVFSAVFGFGMGGLVPLHTALRWKHFGAKHIGAIMGISSPFIMLAQAGGQPFSGWVFDKTGSYHYAFYLFIICYLLSIAIALSVKDPEVGDVE